MKPNLIATLQNKILIMLKAFKYIVGNEIITYQDILDASDGFFIISEHEKYIIDQSIILAETKSNSLKHLKAINDQDSKVYARKKEYRKPVFNEALDTTLDELLYEFAREYSNEEAASEELLEALLRKLKNIFVINNSEQEQSTMFEVKG